MRAIFFVALALVLFSCDPNRVFEENKTIQGKYWYVDSVMTFSFNVPDTIARYNLFANFSHTADYSFNNLYFRYELQDSLKLTLADQQLNIQFFDQKTGQPLGSGLGDIFDHQFLIIDDYKFDQLGVHHLSLQQYMRTDSLPAIRNVGVRVAKATH